MVYSILVVLSFKRGGRFYVAGVVLFLEDGCQKRNKERSRNQGILLEY